MPGPVSTMLMMIYRDFGLRPAFNETLPYSVNLIAFRNTQETSFARSLSSTVLC